MAPDERVGQAQLDSQPADFILEEVAKRLDQLEAKLVREARRHYGES